MTECQGAFWEAFGHVAGAGIGLIVFIILLVGVSQLVGEWLKR